MTASYGEQPCLRFIDRRLTRVNPYSYLRATKWISAKTAIERLEGTLKWRREFGIYDLSADVVEPEVG
jgi:hypothetical protein